jgi:hypothetical protein
LTECSNFKVQTSNANFAEFQEFQEFQQGVLEFTFQGYRQGKPQ